jgi:hypothetical protein
MKNNSFVGIRILVMALSALCFSMMITYLITGILWLTYVPVFGSASDATSVLLTITSVLAIFFAYFAIKPETLERVIYFIVIVLLNALELLLIWSSLGISNKIGFPLLIMGTQVVMIINVIVFYPRRWISQ